MQRPSVKAFFDEATYTITYIVSDPATSRAAIIDPVLDYDAASGRTSTVSADAVIGYLEKNGLGVDWILETHVHADHLSGAPYLQDRLGGQTAIGARVTAVQETFKGVFNLADLATDGSQFDRLFSDGDAFAVGDIEGRVMGTPGHTPACITYVIGDTAYVGDTLFMQDFGTARTDFPGGSASQLYASIQKILSLPDDTRLFMCHDYKAPGRDVYAWETTVATQRDENVHINKTVSEQEFVAMRESRDRELGMPRLLLPSIQVNVRAGQFPDPEDNDVRYLKIPLNAV
ncbi:MAG: MBL fold metallo-hydrolase [Woeseiaceae bacterium]|nr:MBL fold metallo-hydrolase [Woeseiaceae bacterium]